MRAGAALAFLLLTLAAVGCSSSDPEPRVDTRPPPDEPAPPRPKTSSAERLIQAWLAALQTEDYKRAGSYFAANALVDQGAPFRLHSRADAVAFNRSLPCQADLTDVRKAAGATLATFQLHDGPGGACEGSVRVRFRIRDHRFLLFRQLPDAPAATGVQT